MAKSPDIPPPEPIEIAKPVSTIKVVKPVSTINVVKPSKSRTTSTKWSIPSTQLPSEPIQRPKTTFPSAIPKSDTAITQPGPPKINLAERIQRPKPKQNLKKKTPPSAIGAGAAQTLGPEPSNQGSAFFLFIQMFISIFPMQ